MIEAPSQAEASESFAAPLIEKLRRHPKRIVFTEGEDLRVLRTAARLVAAEAGVPILLGDPAGIRDLAAREGVDLKFIRLLNPATSEDFELFCQRFVRIEAYRKVSFPDPEEMVARPHYFGALMVQYGHADALVGGNRALPATLFRALIHTIKPLAEVPKIFGATILSAPHLRNFGGSGMLVLADTGLVPNPTSNELAMIAVEAGKLARHLLGRPARVAMLSHSTRGSAATEEAGRVMAATALARDKARKDYLDLEIDGELQADVALDPKAAEVKLPDAGTRQPADVLVFPNLDAAHISMKLLQHCGGAQSYGALILGIARPVAQVPRTASEETIFGTAAVVGVEAIKYHEAYPEADF